MASTNGTSTTRSMLYNGKTSVLPPKIPFPCVRSSLHPPGSGVGLSTMQEKGDAASHHQRTSSDFLIGEKPSWLDDLLDEPETPLHKPCHRRSSSDSSAYTDFTNYGNMDLESRHDRTQSKQWDAANIAPATHGLYRDTGLWITSHDSDRSQSWLTENKEMVNSGYADAGGSVEKTSSSNSKSPEAETKRTKHQYAQRSRVRRLQYIAELERTVQALQAEGSQASAEIDFINQKNFILSMENKALKQRLEGLAQEHHIKHMEHDMLEREVGRLRNLLQKQLHSSPIQRLDIISKDLEKHFASLTLKPKEAGAAGN